MFEDMTYDAIMRRMLARVPDDLDKREGAVIYDAFAGAAWALALAYAALQRTIDESYADTQSREYLIRRCVERGIAPYPASCAVMRAEITPPELSIAGRRFSLNRYNYVALEEIEPGAWRVQCETAGEAGGRQFGNLVPIEYVDGLKTAKTTACLIPGEEEEDTEALRKRYMASFDERGFGGNIRDYENRVGAIPGVGAVKVTPIWNGPGTVLLTILDAAYGAASAALIEQVQDEIDPRQDGKGYGIAPIGHIVTVDTAKATPIDVQTRLEFARGYDWDALRGEIEETVDAYLLELRRSWGSGAPLVVRVSQIETRILAMEGIEDIGETRINGAGGNFALDAYAIPTLGAVSDGG